MTEIIYSDKESLTQAIKRLEALKDKHNPTGGNLVAIKAKIKMYREFIQDLDNPMIGELEKDD